jgi:AcrR family transcriptional regulator
MESVKTRSYTSPVRARQAAANRAAILSAAHELFLAQGYGATTVEQIAVSAGVSKPTIFAAIGNKAEILKVVRDVALAGDDEPIPVAERATIERIADAQDISAGAIAAAAHIATLNRRSSGIQEVLRGAAAGGDPVMRKLWDRGEQERVTGAGIIVELLAAKGTPLAVSRKRAIEVLALLMAADGYHWLVVNHGWSHAKFCEWLADAIRMQLFGCGKP